MLKLLRSEGQRVFRGVPLHKPGSDPVYQCLVHFPVQYTVTTTIHTVSESSGGTGIGLIRLLDESRMQHHKQQRLEGSKGNEFRN